MTRSASSPGPSPLGTVGPYVVLGEWPTRGGPRYLRVSDHVTGLSAVLQLFAALPVSLEQAGPPASEALLPFTDYLPNAVMPEGIGLVTELPLGARPASDPLLAARGALAGLQVLHGAGRAHGHLHPALLWQVGGMVRVAGGGIYSLGETYTAARDLQDLGRVLELLGGPLPAPLQVLHQPGNLSAQQILESLEKVGDAPRALETAHTQETEPPPAAEALSVAGLPIAEPQTMPRPLPDVPTAASLQPPAPAVAEPEQTQAAVTELAEPAPLKSGTPQPVAPRTATPARPASPQPAAKVPELRLGEVKGAALRAAQRLKADAQRLGQTVPGPAGDAIGRGQSVPVQAARATVSAPPRKLLPVWLWPLLALLLLATLLGLWKGGQPRSQAGCCSVEFRVVGGNSASLTLQSAPLGTGWQAGRSLGTIPSRVQFPAAGTYRLMVSSQGFTPAPLNLTVPTTRPITVNLAP